jgi:hypothetical protein
VKFQKALILIAIPLIFWLFVDNFRPGYSLDQTGWPYILYISFFNDLAFPFCLYFALCLFEPWILALKSWQAKALLAFLLPACIEVGQLIYIKLGLTQVFMTYGGAFDPLDLVVYAAGALFAVLLERSFFAKYFKFWEPNTIQPTSN